MSNRNEIALTRNPFYAPGTRPHECDAPDPHRRRTALDRAEIADEQIQSDEVFDARVREEAAGEAMSGDRWESQS